MGGCTSTYPVQLVDFVMPEIHKVDDVVMLCRGYVDQSNKSRTPTHPPTHPVVLGRQKIPNGQQNHPTVRILWHGNPLLL